MKERKEKRELPKETKRIVCIVIACIACIVFCCIAVRNQKNNRDAKQTDTDVDQALQEIRDEQSGDVGNQKKSVRDIEISKELASFLTDEDKNAVKELAAVTEGENGAYTINTEYAEQRTKIKTYCKDTLESLKVEAASMNADNGGYSIAYDENTGTLRYNFSYEEASEIVNRAEGLLGLYQRVANCDEDWCVIVFTSDGEYAITDENTENRVEIIGTETDAASNTDAEGE